MVRGIRSDEFQIHTDLYCRSKVKFHIWSLEAIDHMCPLGAESGGTGDASSQSKTLGRRPPPKNLATYYVLFRNFILKNQYFGIFAKQNGRNPRKN